MYNIPRVMIAGTHSGVGKTTIVTAVMAMLSNAGLRVQPFKVGPDYIDPGFHRVATGRISRNLDSFFLGEEGVKEIFVRSSLDADISIIEGVMGLYDGIGAGDEGSSAWVAKILRCPVILVVDARSMAHSAAALVWGYANLPGGIPVAGVILNRVGSQHHYQILKEAITEKTGIPVLGCMMRNSELHLPERHLGLVPCVENNSLNDIVAMLGELAAQGISREKLLNLARSAPVISAAQRIFAVEPGEPVRLAIIRDKAFNFYYQDGLDLLKTMGAELVTCSALEDETLPENLDGLYIGGGFPEMFIEQLAENRSFINDLQRRAANGMPVYAECGGLMYLCQTISDISGQHFYHGAGILPARCKMEKKRVALGYVTATALVDNILVDKGTVLRGHEFHYSNTDGTDLKPAFLLKKTSGERGRADGYVSNSVLATYLHLHFAGSTGAARGLLRSCAKYRHFRRRIGN